MMISPEVYGSYVELVSNAVQATSEAIKHLRTSDLHDVHRMLGDASRSLSEADAVLRQRVAERCANL